MPDRMTGQHESRRHPAIFKPGLFEFSRHALKRAVERNISEAEIREAGATFTIIEDYPDDKYSPSCLGLGFTRNARPLHLQVCYTAPERDAQDYHDL